MSRALFVFILACFLCGCQVSKLEKALKMSGDNRGELERVLDYYSKDPSDSTKLRAARYLIENMPGHYSYAGDGINEYYAKADPVLRSNLSAEQKRDSIEHIAEEFPNLYLDVVEDLKIIKADYLIHNIDISFKDWTENRILRHITFDQFCEFILPYKVTELQQLDYWKDSLRGKYSTNYRTKPIPSRFQSSIYYAANTINSEINATIPQPYLHGKYYNFLRASNIDRLPFGTCDDYSLLATAILRSEGIPAFNDGFNLWINKATGHSWYGYPNSDGNIHPFYWGLQSSSGGSFFIDEPVPKVWRHSYAKNLKAEHYLHYCEKQPLYVDLFKQDVTHEYIATSNIAIPLNKSRLRKDKWAYIAVFNDQNWRLADYGSVRKGKAYFENMGRNIVYLVFMYDGFRLIPVSDPFILRTDGNIEYLVPNHNDIKVVTLERKYPKNEHCLLVESRMVGGIIQGSDNPDFSNAESFYTFTDKDYGRLVAIDNTRQYRFWRFYSAPGSLCNIAELEFYPQLSDSPLYGEIIGTLEYHGNEELYHYSHAFDGDWLTHFSANQPNDGWIGLDFGQPVCIDRVRCVPRSDDNGIRVGDEYELFYWLNGRWESLGKQVETKNNYLKYEVPANALLLLKNNTRGKEERIFTYESDEQIWW